MATVDEPTPVTYNLYNTLTGAYIDSLPLRGVTFSGGPINQYGSFQGYFDLEAPLNREFNWIQATSPTKTTLIVDYEGLIMWGGAISGRKETFGSSGFQLEIDAQEGWAWWNQVMQATDYSAPPYSGITGNSTPMPYWNYANGTSSVTNGGMTVSEPYIWDPMLIAAQVITDTLAVSTQNIYGGMAVNLNGYQVNGGSPDYGAAYRDSMITGRTPTPADNFISITFPYPSLQLLSAMLSQLQALGFTVGFDGAIDYNYVTPMEPASGIQATVNLTYPYRGVAVGAQQYLLGGEINRLSINCNRAFEWSFPEDGTMTASTVYETGGNQDIVVRQNVYPVTESGDNPYPYPNTARVFNIANLNSPDPTNLLTNMAKSDLNLYSWPPVSPYIIVDMFDSDVGIEQFVVGDQIITTVPQFGQDGYVFDPRFPTGFQASWRIISYDATVGDDGNCTLKINLDTPPADGTGVQTPMLYPNS